METIEDNKITDETLSGVSLTSQPSDDSHKILKPSLEERVGNDLGLENELFGGGDATVVVTTTTVVEKIEVSVVEMIQEDAILKNQEGYFGNLVDGDEGTKVNCSENGNSLVMDVECSLAGENDENAPRDLMDICLSGQKETNDENGPEIIESLEDENKNNESNAGSLANKNDENTPGDPMDVCVGPEFFESKEDTNKNDEKTVENGEEYDGEHDEIEEENHDFVVGDFVWGENKNHPWYPGRIYGPSNASDYPPSLKCKGRLLVAYFGDGSFSWCSPSQLKPFIDHFQEMSNQSDSKKFVNAVQKALEEVSRVVKAELMCKCQTIDGLTSDDVVLKGNTVKVLMDRMMQPVELLEILKDSATMVRGATLLELEHVVLKSCLSVFYGKKGGYLLPEYHDPKCIEGLEDESRSKNGPSESAENGDEKLYQRRKKKSVADLLKEDEPKIKKTKTLKDDGSSKRKRKALVVSVTPESDQENGGVEEEMMSPRQRKKSKYLSPPYLSPIGGGKLSILGSGSGSGSFKEPKTEPEKVPEMAAKQLEDSLKKRRVRKGSNSKDSKEHMKVDEVLNGLLRAALDPSSFVVKNLQQITDFISSFRRSVFENGSNYQPDLKKDSPMALVIEFPSEATLPTKADLLKTYKKFGDLIEKETRINGSRALVVFGNSDDAEAALVMSLEKKPFGDVKYRVSEVVSCVKRGSRKAAGGDVSDLVFIKEKMEMMGEMVKRCEMSAGVKKSLEGGIKEVLELVGKMKGK